LIEVQFCYFVSNDSEVKEYLHQKNLKTEGSKYFRINQADKTLSHSAVKFRVH